MIRVRWRRLGIRIRLALIYSAIFGVVLSVFCLVLFQTFEKQQIKAFDDTLRNFATDISTNLEIDFVGRLFVTVEEEDKVLPFHLGQTFLEIRDLTGRILVYSRSLNGKNLPFETSSLQSLAEEKAIFRTIRINGNDMRLVTYWASRADWTRPLILQVAVPLDFPRHERQNLILFFLFAIPLALLMTGAAGVAMSQRALKPVKEMTMKAHQMGLSAKLSERIPVPKQHDEIRELAETFNGLLDRLEKAFDSQDRFISNASHQLKTPLTILKGELNLIKKRNPTPSEMSEFVESASGEIEHMIHLVEDLLMLARLEAGKDNLVLRPVELDEVLLNVVSRIQKIAKNKNVQIHTSFLPESPDQEFEARVSGDEELLACLFENLIENAVKYTPEASVVDVQLKTRSGGIDLFVADEGPGITAENRQKIFERFQRGYPSSFVQGSGLGLSIASEIAQLHGVEISVHDNVGRGHGTRIGVSFPRPT